MSRRSIEHVELGPVLGEALSQYLAREIGRPTGRSLGLNVGRFCQTRKQALQAFSAGEKGLELHGAVAARAKPIDIEAAFQELEARPPSAAARTVGRSGFVHVVAGWMFGVGMLSGVGARGQLWDHERSPGCGGRQNSCVPHGVKAGCGDGSSQAALQGEWVEIDREGSVGERAFEGDTTQAALECLQA